MTNASLFIFNEEFKILNPKDCIRPISKKTTRIQGKSLGGEIYVHLKNSNKVAQLIEDLFSNDGFIEGSLMFDDYNDIERFQCIEFSETRFISYCKIFDTQTSKPIGFKILLSPRIQKIGKIVIKRNSFDTDIYQESIASNVIENIKGYSISLN